MRGLFVVHAERPRTLLIGEEAGLAVIASEVERLRGAASPSAPPGNDRWRPLVLMGSDSPFPFRARPSSIIVPGIPQGVIACNPLLEAHGIPNRLATRSDFPGCFDGVVTGLADVWLGSLGETGLAEVEILACGPPAMLEATRELANRYGVPCQAAPAEPEPDDPAKIT